MFDHVLNMRQDFVRTVLGSDHPQSCKKDRPLVFFLDDHLGNAKRSLIDLATVSQATQLLTTHYGLPSISYPDATRDLKYSDTKEHFLTDQWFTKDSKFTYAIHPGEGMHMTIAWMILYNLIEVASSHCSSQGLQPRTGEDSKFPAKNALPIQAIPALNPGLELTNVTHAWKAARFV